MVQRYAHLSTEHLANHVDRVSGARALRLVGGKAVVAGYDLATAEAKQKRLTRVSL